MIIKYYNLIYQYVMFFNSRWDGNFTLGLVGIRVDDLLWLVGTGRRPNALLERPNKIFTIHSQWVSAFFLPLLGCWDVGPENDPSLNVKKNMRIDRNESGYHDKLPDEFRQVPIIDILVDGKRKTGILSI